MLKLWKVNAKAGDATVKYPFAPFPTNKDMRGKPEHNAELCIACGACGVACPADAIRMDTDLAADTITWSIDYGRCIFCGRCEEACPMEAIKLTEEFELAVMSKDDLTSKSVYTLEHCSRCGKPFAPHKEIDYAKRLLQKAGGGQIKSALRLIGHLEQMRIQGGKGGVKLPQGVRVVIHDSEYWLDDGIRFCRHDKKDAACAGCSFWRRWQPASAQCRKHGAHARLLLWKCSLKKA